jgi:hypothetical protein
MGLSGRGKTGGKYLPPRMVPPLGSPVRPTLGLLASLGTLLAASWPHFEWKMLVELAQIIFWNRTFKNGKLCLQNWTRCRSNQLIFKVSFPKKKQSQNIKQITWGWEYIFYTCAGILCTLTCRAPFHTHTPDNTIHTYWILHYLNILTDYILKPTIRKLKMMVDKLDPNLIQLINFRTITPEKKLITKRQLTTILYIVTCRAPIHLRPSVGAILQWNVCGTLLELAGPRNTGGKYLPPRMVSFDSIFSSDLPPMQP